MFSEDSTAALVALDQEAQSSPSLSHTVKGLCYRLALQHQGSIQRSKTRPSLKVYMQLFFALITAIQVLSVLIDYMRDTSGFPSFDYVPKTLQLVRPDVWVVNGQLGVAGLLGSLAVLGTVVGELVLEVVLLHFKPAFKMPRAALDLVDFPLVLVRRYIAVPLILLYFRAIHVSFFLDSSEDSQFQEFWKGVLGLLGLGGFSALALLHASLVYDNAWPLRSHFLLAQANASYDIKEYITLAAICAVREADLTPILALFLSAVLSVYLFVQLLWYLPYYHKGTMLGKVLEFGVCAWASIAGFAGIVANSMLVTVMLFLFVTPCLALLIARLLQWRLSLVSFKREAQPFWKFELAIRKKLEKEESSAKECLEFGAKLYTNVSKEYYLLLAHYYYYVCDDAEIALVRLTSAELCPGSITADFQIWRLSRALYDISRSEEREFVDYQSLYQSARSLDSSLCEMTYDLLNVIINKNSNEQHLERSFLNLAAVIRRAQQAYRSLKVKFATDPFVLLSYGSFLGDIFHESVAQELITRGYFELNRRKKTHINTIESYSSADTGVMIVSCHPKSFGKVIYVNEQIGKVVGCKTAEMVGKDLDDFIPPPYNYKHNRKLTNFLACGEAKEIFRSHLFLSSNQRYSVEVTFRFRPTVVRETPYFVVAVRPKPNTREFAIFDSDFCITSHSLSFASAVSVTSRKYMSGERLEDLLPGVTQHLASPYPFIYQHPEKDYNVGVKFAEVSLGNGTIHWIYVLRSERGIEDLLTSMAGEDVARFKRSLRESAGAMEERGVEYENSDNTVSKATGVSSERQITREPPSISFTVTKDDGTTTTNVLTSYAKSSTGSALRRQCGRAVTTFKFAYLGMILLVAVFLALALAVLYTTLQSLSESSASVDLGTSRLHQVKIAHLARRLNLIQSGFEASEGQSTLQKQLSAEIASLSNVMDNYLKQSKSLVSLYSLVGSQYSFQELSLITALTDYNTHAQFLVSNPALSEFSTDFFFVYYNGFANLMHSLNQTIDQQLVEMRENGIQVIEITCASAFLVLLFVLILGHFCVGKSLYDLERCYGKLWTTLVNIPINSAREIMNIHRDRIEVTHGMEFFPMEQSRLKENHSLMRPPNRRLALAAKVSVFALGSLAFVFATLMSGRTAINVLLGANSHYLDTIAYSTILPTCTLHLAKELYLSAQSGHSYFNITKEGQHIASLSNELSAGMDRIAVFEQRILSNMIDISSSSAAGLFPNFDLPYSNACGLLNSSTTCGDTALAKGQHPTISDFRLRLRDISKRIQQSALPWTELFYLEDYVDQVTETTIQLLQLTQSYAAASSRKFTSDMLAYACVYLLGSGLIYSLLYLPTIAALRRRCMSLWRITTLIRYDFINRK